MSLLHIILCAAMIGVSLWRYKYVSEGTWDRRLAYTAIVGGCTGSLLLHWHGGEMVARAGMVWLIGSGAFRETRAEWRVKAESAGVKPRHVKEGRAA
jgi:hypothetical protein